VLLEVLVKAGGKGTGASASTSEGGGGGGGGGGDGSDGPRVVRASGRVAVIVRTFAGHGPR
jgi:hypothetical protein